MGWLLVMFGVGVVYTLRNVVFVSETRCFVVLHGDAWAVST